MAVSWCRIQLFYIYIFRVFGGSLLTLALLAGEVRAQSPDPAQGAWIEAIRFVGNDKTKPRILRQEMVIQEGDPADPLAIERSRQAIMDLGLFKSVDARLEPGQQPQGKILEFAVSEKYYVIPLPQLDRDADGEISYGGRLTVYNLGGLNQRLRMTYEAKSGGVVERTVNSVEMSYTYPRVAGTHYGLGVGLGRSITPISTRDGNGETVTEHDQIHNSASIGVSRWLSREGPSQGWTAGLSTFWRYRLFEQKFGPADPLRAEKAVGITADIGYTRVHDYLYSREGLQYGFITEHGLTAMGSDTPYSRNQLYYRHYFPIGEIQQHRNLNLQLRLGSTGGSIPIVDFPYVLGGSSDLRGYSKDTIGGRSFFLMNVEFLAPLWGHNAARGVVFADLGNAYDDNRLLDFGDLESSAGFGLRYRVKSFVDFQIRLDVSYAFGLDRRKVYVGSRNTF